MCASVLVCFELANSCFSTVLITTTQSTALVCFIPLCLFCNVVPTGNLFTACFAGNSEQGCFHRKLNSIRCSHRKLNRVFAQQTQRCSHRKLNRVFAQQTQRCSHRKLNMVFAQQTQGCFHRKLNNRVFAEQTQ